MLWQTMTCAITFTIAFFNTPGIFHKVSDTFFIGDEYPSVVSKQHSIAEILWRERLFQILTEDYVNNEIPPKLNLKPLTIIKRPRVTI